MALSFWTIMPLALFLGAFTYIGLRSLSFILRTAASITVFLVCIRLLGTVSTFVLARVYGIELKGSASLERRQNLRAKIENLMELLQMDQPNRTAVRQSIVFGSLDERRVVSQLEQKLANRKDASASPCEITDEDIPF
jgi:hypothetical protein